jgi:hypothetical protein
MPTLRSHDPIDLPLHRLLQHRQANPRSQRQQTPAGIPGDLTQRQPKLRGQLKTRVLPSRDSLNVL